MFGSSLNQGFWITTVLDSAVHKLSQKMHTVVRWPLQLYHSVRNPSSLVLPALHVQVEDQLPLLLCLGLYQQAVSKQILQGLQVNVLCKLWIKQTGLKSSVSQTEDCFRSKCRRRKNNQVINWCSITFRSGRINLMEEEGGGGGT